MAGKEDPMVNFRSVGCGSTPVEEVKAEAFLPQPLPTEDEKAADCHHPPTVEDEKPLAESATANASEEVSVWEESEELVEMRPDYLSWLLEQTRETDPVPTLDEYNTTHTSDPVKLKRMQEDIHWLQAAEDEFFEYQAWARSMLERVMVPKDEVSREEFQQSINDFWDGLLKAYDDKKKADSKTEVDTSAEPSN